MEKHPGPSLPPRPLPQSPGLNPPHPLPQNPSLNMRTPLDQIFRHPRDHQSHRMTKHKKRKRYDGRFQVERQTL